MIFRCPICAEPITGSHGTYDASTTSFSVRFRPCGHEVPRDNARRQTRTVPDSIDPTGKTDCTDALTEWLNEGAEDGPFP